VSRRASLPGASELFRRTSSPALDQPALLERSSVEGPGRNGNGSAGGSEDDTGGGRSAGEARRQLARSAKAAGGSGRQKHDAKITVYVSNEELLAMEQTRLALRGSHELVVDRGRLVREAVAVLLADFEEHGEDSVLVQRLRDTAGEAAG
jgi:hypothetical protein